MPDHLKQTYTLPNVVIIDLQAMEIRTDEVEFTPRHTWQIFKAPYDIRLMMPKPLFMVENAFPDHHAHFIIQPF